MTFSHCKKGDTFTLQEQDYFGESTHWQIAP